MGPDVQGQQGALGGTVAFHFRFENDRQKVDPGPRAAQRPFRLEERGLFQ